MMGGGTSHLQADGLTLTDIARRNFVFTSIEDDAAFDQLDVIGEDKVMVETDYPHFDSTWPECQAMVRKELSHLPSAVVRKVCFENRRASIAILCRQRR